MYLQGLLTFCYISLLSNAGERIAARLRKQLFEAIITQDIEFFDKNKTGELVNRYCISMNGSDFVGLQTHNINVFSSILQIPKIGMII